MSAIEVKLIPVAQIAAPSLVRFATGHDQESLSQLAASIKRQGLLQPIVVRPASVTDDEADLEHQWIIVAGRRRLAAFKLAGLEEIPALISGTDEAAAYEAEAAENLHRQDMSIAEKATYVRTLMTIYNNAKKVCEIVAKSPAWVSKMLSITDSKNPSEISDLLDRGIVEDLETLLLLRQIALMPASHPDAARTLTRMLKIAHDGNMTRQIARDALAKLKAPAGAPSPSATVTTTTTGGGKSERVEILIDPETEFHVTLPIDLLEAFESLGGKDWLIEQISAADKA